MTWSLFCGFDDREDAQRAFGALLEQGIASEDMSLATRARGSAVADQRRARRLIDSGQVHLEELRLGRTRVEREGVEGLESSVGGGIGTDSYDDDVSGIEEMDDAPDVAENVAEPVQRRWYGQDDLEDAERFAQAGSLGSTRPPTPAFGTRHARVRAERPYSLTVVGRVLLGGDGALATELLGLELAKAPQKPVEALKASLYGVGVAAAEVVALVRTFEEGGAVLSVAQEPGRVPMTEVESLLEELGARQIHSFVQKGA